MSKHTPGEWHVFDNRDDKDFDIHDPARVGVGGEFYDIAHCSGFNCGKSGDEVLANARLIAAAPQLLEALKELRDAEAALFPSAEDGMEAQNRWADRKSEARRKANEAIAAVEGKQ